MDFATQTQGPTHRSGSHPGRARRPHRHPQHHHLQHGNRQDHPRPANGSPASSANSTGPKTKASSPHSPPSNPTHSLHPQPGDHHDARRTSACPLRRTQIPLAPQVPRPHRLLDSGAPPATADGYGRFKVGGRVQHAHRYAYEHLFGRLTKQQVLRHTCHCRQCCNPEHLIPGTQAENIADREARGSTARGERNGRSRLTADQVSVIRDRAAQGETSYRIAKDYGVSPRCIDHIRDGRTWSVIPNSSFVIESASSGPEGAQSGAPDIELRNGAHASGFAPLPDRTIPA